MLSLLAGLCLIATAAPAGGLHLDETRNAATVTSTGPARGEVASTAPEGGLQHPGPRADGTPAPAFDQGLGFDPTPWRERLQDEDLAARERAYDQLLERALADERAARAVREWAQGSDGLAWTARLMQRELERRGSAGAWRTFREDGLRGMRERLRGFEGRMERMRTELERDLQGWFDERSTGPRDGQPGTDGGGLRHPGAETRPELGARGGARTRTKSIEARQDKDGARVEVRTQDDEGREDVQTYTGGTLEEIYRAHPQLREGTQMRVELDGPGLRPGAGREEGGLRRPEVGQGGERRGWQGPESGLVPQRGMLGIACQPVGEELRRTLGLPEGNGLVVESVVEGSIAARIGLRPADVVVELNGRSIKTREDVAEVLAERRSGEDLQVVIVDKDGKRRTLTHRN